MSKYAKHARFKTPEYRAWEQMKRRCKRNPRYIAKGISPCERWRDSFQNFFADIGLRPSPKHTLERIKNDLGYSPDNCCWATRLEQSRNRENTLWVIFRGVRMSVVEVAKITGLSKGTIYDRLERGFSDEEACSSINYRVRRRAK